MNRPSYICSAASIALAAIFLGLSNGLAFAEVLKGDYLGKTVAEIARALEAEGYEIMEFEKENGLMEFDVETGGIAWEIQIDPETGKVVSIEEDD